jgi:ADP-heptose:LPS heptosyltransferase
MNILIKRMGALGDVLCATPIVRRFRTEYPEAFIGVETGYPNVFHGNSDVDGINIQREWNKFALLDMAHETRRNMQAIEAYAEATFGDRGENMDKSIVFATGLVPPIGVNWKKTIVIHANKSWPNRTMPNEWWDEICNALSKDGYKIVALGTEIDYCPSGAVDTRSKLTIHQQGAVIGASKLLICGASGLFILAAATACPVVVPMTINRPETALPWRWGKQGEGFYPLIADVPCLGCSERAGPVTNLGCEVGTFKCIPTIKASQAVEKSLEILKSEKTNDIYYRSRGL